VGYQHDSDRDEESRERSGRRGCRRIRRPAIGRFLRDMVPWLDSALPGNTYHRPNFPHRDFNGVDMTDIRNGDAAAGPANSASANAGAEERAPESIDTVTIAQPRSALYAFWRDFTNLPKFMENVQSVTAVDSISSLWTIKDTAGHTTEWEFIVTDDEADRLIAWASSGNTPVKYSGRVEFKDAPAEQGTEVTAMIHYDTPSGLIENLIAKVAGPEPNVQTRADLYRFKQYMESAPHVESGAGGGA
jgi:uncharacterized membrane protein